MITTTHRELAHRRTDGLDVRLLWEPGTDRVSVSLMDAKTGDGFEVSVVNGRLKGMMEHQFPVVLGRDLAAASGAYVISAHATVNGTGDVPAAVSALRPPGIHAVVHLAGDGLGLADLLIPGGRIASTVGSPPDRRVQSGGRYRNAGPAGTLAS